MTQSVAAPTNQQRELNPDAYATISLFCALIGLGLPAVVFGHIAYAKLPSRTGGRMAVAGFVIGYLEIAVILIYLLTN
ncbi:hypothetical protein [Rhodococcus erythropolis]|uniref:hypothetical protein n=1 Tax=Rhodococcus erythropolis TaxID=1833 RepID=UPI0037FF6E61